MPALREASFRPAVAVPGERELLALTDDQRRDFLDFFGAGVQAHRPAHRRVHAYLQRRLSDIRFEQQTLSAADTIALLRGNCMSLALVTTALADAAGVEIDWQLADTDPVYSSEGTVVYRGNHIQSRLHERAAPARGPTISLGRGYLLLDYFTDDLPTPGTPLARHEMLALVYQNLGAEAMADGDLARAFWLLREALRHDPENADVYNALAVVHRRSGDADTAEALFRFALAEFGDRLVVLRNYRRLLIAAGRTDEAERIQQRLLALPDADPFPMIRLGDEALGDGDAAAALAYYRKARTIAPYLHEIHFRMARAHFALGDHARGVRQLEQGRSKARAESERSRYERKLETLQRDS